MKRINFWKSCDITRLEILLSTTKDIEVFKKIQAVYLKAKYNLEAKTVAQITGYSVGHVWRVHANYRNIGEKVFVLGKKGGAYRTNLSNEQESELLTDFEEKSNAGHILEVSQIKNKYEELIGRPVDKSVVYRMLARHGWRKITPRPSHPKNNPAAMSDFKKNSRRWCKTI